MFYELPPEIGDLPDLADPAVVEAIGGWARLEAAACARKHAAMAELFTRRTECDTAADRASWLVDPDAAVGAEIGAAQNISSSLALFQTQRAVALRDRLPRVAALFAEGLINDALVRAIISRTTLITDPDVIADVDRVIAARARRWGRLSARKTEAAIDAVVEEADAGAVRRARAAATDRTIEFFSYGGEAGLAGICGRMLLADAVALDQRLDQMAHAVCDDDPRTIGERRTEAMASLSNGILILACRCGDTDCPAATKAPRPERNTIVYVITDENASSGDTAQEEADTAADANDQPVTGQAEEPANADPVHPEPTDPKPAQCRRPLSYVLGGGILPTALLAAATTDARRRIVRHPGDNTAPEDRYTPSRGLADYIRCRDLTCRFPGCEKPADRADIDHTIPWPYGPTHASNLKCLCRFHHLVKTFWTGPGGWTDVQYPDGTIEWTSPTGHVYTTHPGSTDIFPTLCRPTGTLPPGDRPPPDHPVRGLAMPTRRRTRAQNRSRAIDAERRLNDDIVAERNRPPPF